MPTWTATAIAMTTLTKTGSFVIFLFHQRFLYASYSASEYTSSSHTLPRPSSNVTRFVAPAPGTAANATSPASSANATLHPLLIVPVRVDLVFVGFEGDGHRALAVAPRALERW